MIRAPPRSVQAVGGRRILRSVKLKNVDIHVENADCAAVQAAAVVIEDPRLQAGIPPAVEAASAPGGPAVIRVSIAGAEGAPDEHSVRAACAGALDAAARASLPSIALPALGCREGGLGPTASGKIMAQEVIRRSRHNAPHPARIVFCVGEAAAFKEFEKALLGYIGHFLDVLIWGPFVTVDAIIEVPLPQAAGFGIVLVKRSNPPFGFALPGGFVDYGESLEEAVRREALEETGLELLDLRQFHTYSDVDRDPRFHTVTTVFSARAEGSPRAGDDAAAVRTARPEEIKGLKFAFDHRKVLEEYLMGREGRRSPS